jgi:anaerobic dimethyl sulfoxide reductase subunit C (anchor subunit)
MLKEWPLVAFTILGQTAVGLFILGATIFCLLPLTPDEPMRDWLWTWQSVVLGLLVAAAFLSFFHLRHPLRARRVLANFRTSRLSREIFYLLAFMVLVAGEMVLVAMNATVGVLRSVQVAGCLVGGLFLYSMIGLYMLDTLPFWSQAGTPMSFAGSSLALGAVALTVFGGRFIWIPAAVLFVFLDLVGSVLFAPGYGLLSRRPTASLRPPAIAPRFLHLLGLGLESAGFILLIVIALALSREWEGPVLLMAVCVTLILAGQVIRRFLFYGLVPRPGD